MAKVVLNPALQVLSGDVAGFVYRQQSDGSVVVAKKGLQDPNRELSEAQLDQMQKFKEASARYRRLLEDNDIQAAYQTLLKERGEKRLRAGAWARSTCPKHEGREHRTQSAVRERNAESV